MRRLNELVDFCSSHDNVFSFAIFLVEKMFSEDKNINLTYHMYVQSTHSRRHVGVQLSLAGSFKWARCARSLKGKAVSKLNDIREGCETVSTLMTES